MHSAPTWSPSRAIDIHRSVPVRFRSTRLREQFEAYGHDVLIVLTVPSRGGGDDDLSGGRPHGTIERQSISSISPGFQVFLKNASSGL